MIRARSTVGLQWKPEFSTLHWQSCRWLSIPVANAAVGIVALSADRVISTG
jgi:hypothetical protein